MASRLNTLSMQSPGFLGLNTQESGVLLDQGYATVANNCIIDSEGRLGSRRGFRYKTEVGSRTTSPITSLFEYKKVDGSFEYLSGTANALLVGLETPAIQAVYDTTGTSVVSLTNANGEWDFASMPKNSGASAESIAFIACEGQTLLARRFINGADRYFQVANVPTGFTVGDFDPNTIHSAYGRLWAARTTFNRTTVYYSQLLNGEDFTGVGSGVLDVSAVVGNNDEIVALSSHNNSLIVFCKNNIVIYNNADNPTNIVLADVINGVGCAARQTVQQTGTDLIFLSQSGVRSLNRTIQEKSMPMRELSINVHDKLNTFLDGEDLTLVKAGYSERHAFYLLTLPNVGITYCFDLRLQLDNGAARTTIWPSFKPTAFETTENRELFFGWTEGIVEYYGYNDDGEGYYLEYYTPWNDLGMPTNLKFLKKSYIVGMGIDFPNLVLKYAFDYSGKFEYRVLRSKYEVTPSFYNEDEYGIGEYSGSLGVHQFTNNLGNSGKTVKFGLACTVKDTPISFQKVDLYLTIGKTH